MTWFTPDRGLEALRGEIALQGKAIAATPPNATVPMCPDWTVTDLAVHIAGVYRWVGTMVSESRDRPPNRDQRRELFSDPDRADAVGVLTRLDEAADRILTTLAEAQDSQPCWTIWDTGHPARHFWIRRMLHETLVHRVDAQNALDGHPTSGADLDREPAADGVDEIMCGFAARYEATLRTDSECVLAVRAIDVEAAWWAALGPDAPTFGRGEPPRAADLTVSGQSGELLLWLWNRRDAVGLDTRGDAGLLTTWRAGAHL
jgi:uncharacterized protein (TIGR03083 family)